MWPDIIKAIIAPKLLEFIKSEFERKGVWICEEELQTFTTQLLEEIKKAGLEYISQSEMNLEIHQTDSSSGE